jgi:hypothetical protein
MTDNKLIHDFKSDLASLQEGLLLLSQTADDQLKDKILNLMLAKCELIEKNIHLAKENLRQGTSHELRPL